MPFVRSYYRRSAGSADAAAAEKRHNLRVVVYDGVASTRPVKSRGRQRLTDLQFSTQLPGGFGQCSFTVTGAAAQQWPIDTGHKVIVWDGRQVVWMGWIEDITRGKSSLSVLALGPWQELQQLLVTETYYGSSDVVVNAVLDQATYVSDNRSFVDSSLVQVNGYVATRATLASVIETMCTIGNGADQQMLFALYDSRTERLTLGRNIMWDGDAEQPSGSSAYGFTTRSTTKVYSGSNSAYTKLTVDAPAAHPINSLWLDDRHLCSASTTYQVSGWIYTDTALGANTIDVDIEWYSSAPALLETDTLTLAAADVPANTWTHFSFIATSHASSHYFRVTVVQSGGTSAVYVDAMSVCLVAVSDAYTRLPVAYFWPRDLTDYEYLLRGAGTEWQETTRTLANYVIVTYGSSSATSAAEDGTSQAAYRRRDTVVAAGSDATQTMAEALRDAYLAAHKDPATELASSSWSYERITGQLTDSRGRPVALARVRAGERVKIMDGEYAGSVVLINSTEWRNGQLTITPERYAAVAELLARSV